MLCIGCFDQFTTLSGRIDLLTSKLLSSTATSYCYSRSFDFCLYSFNSIQLFFIGSNETRDIGKIETVSNDVQIG